MIIRTSELTNTVFVPAQVVKDEIPKFLFIGRSNVGKSTLINKLLRRKKMAKTSSRPGKTISINYYLINEEFYLVDLPGYGYSKISIMSCWQVSQSASRSESCARYEYQKGRCECIAFWFSEYRTEHAGSSGVCQTQQRTSFYNASVRSISTRHSTTNT